MNIRSTTSFRTLIGALLVSIGLPCLAADKGRDPAIYFGEDRNRYLRATFSVQFWLRYTDMNPGTEVSGDPTSAAHDPSIRRFRLGASSMPIEKLFLRLNTGFNNLNPKSYRSTDLRLLDLYGEYRPARAFHFGAGKSAWRGLSRNSAPQTTALLTGDLPIVATPTLNVKDEILRTLNVYAKGQIGKLDYRIVFFEPASVGESPGIDDPAEEGIADFVDDPDNEGNGTSGYLKWQFFEHESNASPFSSGTYLGNKKVMNVGAGYDYQSRGAVYLSNGEPVFVDLKQWAIDFFMELPVNADSGAAATLYSGYFDYDLGPNLVRNIAVNNIASDVNPVTGSFNGGGNGYPIVGTGNSLYLQAGYLTGRFRKWQFQPYFDVQYADWERLSDKMVSWNIGFNWYLNDQNSKLTFNLQTRPIYFERVNGITQEDRKRMFYVQYQWRL